jgi:hypothetical protein
MILNLLILLSAIPNIFNLIINMSSNKKFLEESRKKSKNSIFKSSHRNSETKCLSTLKESGVKLRSNSSYCSKIRNINEISYIHQNNLKKERGRRHSCNNPAAIFDLSQSKIISIIMEDKKPSETNRVKRRSVAVRSFTESSDIDLKRKSRIVSYQINQKRKRSVTDEIIKDQMPSIIYFLNDVNSSRKSSNVSNFNYNDRRYRDFFHKNSSDLFFINRKLCSNTNNKRVNSDCPPNFNSMKKGQKSKSDEIILNSTLTNFPRNSILRIKNSKRSSCQSYFHNK